MKIDFLISSERSGSNLITKLLDNHSLYCGPTPPHLLRVFHKKTTIYGDLTNDKNWGFFIQDIFDFFNCKIGVWQSTLSKNELLEIKPRNLAEVVKHIYYKEALFHNKKHLFIKEVKTYHFFKFLIAHYAQPRFIWLVRDPRDMALSWSQSPVHRGDIIRAAKIWKEDQYETLKIYEKYKDEILLVKYEDLISNQVDVLKVICEFLKIPFDSNMVEFHRNKTSKDNAVQTVNWRNLDKEIIVDNFKKYIQNLSQEQIEYIEFVCQDEMKRLNYTFDFPLLSQQKFETIENKFRPNERQEKPEYLLLSELERKKRKNWFEKYIEIQER